MSDPTSEMSDAQQANAVEMLPGLMIGLVASILTFLIMISGKFLWSTAAGLTSVIGVLVLPWRKYRKLGVGLVIGSIPGIALLLLGLNVGAFHLPLI